MNNCQHGFRPKRSTESALAELCQFVYKALNNQENSIAIMFDLSRAFDTIDHKLLLEKLQRLGVRGVTNKWISSYLEKRTQIVILDNCKSEPKEVMAGVPQGSILGPLFFIIFMNDMVLSCDTPDKTVIYADDTNFFVSSKVLQDAIGKANHSTEQFQTWCTNNGLTLNSNKTKYISFCQKI
nr:unnamed protein product [Callosobruchus chinensis]